jgi:hypothetical protein
MWATCRRKWVLRGTLRELRHFGGCRGRIATRLLGKAMCVGSGGCTMLLRDAGGWGVCRI